MSRRQRGPTSVLTCTVNFGGSCSVDLRPGFLALQPFNIKLQILILYDSRARTPIRADGLEKFLRALQILALAELDFLGRAAP